MKVLLSIQGTGNGHLSRAIQMIPYLSSQCELDILVSGTESELHFPFPLTYAYRGFSFRYNAKGGIHYRATWRNLSTHILREIRALPVEKYDLVINDFEPISAWAARFKKVPCIALGHQASFLSPDTPRPKRRDLFGEIVLRFYAPADHYIGLHFDSYDSDIAPPIIREDLRQIIPEDQGHYTVYLPAFGTVTLLGLLDRFPGTSWHVFMKGCTKSFRHNDVWVRPVDAAAFSQSLATCSGVLTGAGFETPAEALYLGKKLMVVPIKGQYEQLCNAAALSNMGIPVVQTLSHPSTVSSLHTWMDSQAPDRHLYPDFTKQLVDKALAWGHEQLLEEYPTRLVYPDSNWLTDIDSSYSTPV